MPKCISGPEGAGL